jgi:hypothetical protein
MFDTDVEDEVARLALGNPGMFQLTAPANRAFYGGLELDDGLTPYDIEQCREELAGRAGLTPEDVWTLTEGSTLVSQAEAVIALAAQVEREESELELAVSAEARDKLAAKGKGFALADGSYPVHDAHHLGIAKAFFKQGKHGAHHPAEIKAHINRAAARLGLPGLDDDEDDDTEDRADREAARRKPRSRRYPHHTKPVQVVRRGQHLAGEGGEAAGGEGPSGGDGAAMSARRVAVRTPHGYQTLALSASQADELGFRAGKGGPVDRIMARNPELFLANTDNRMYNPAAVGPFETGTTKNVVKHFDFEVHEVDRDDTEQDTRTTDEIARLLAVADSVMGREKPYGSVNRYAPKTVGQRRLEQARASTRPENRIER